MTKFTLFWASRCNMEEVGVGGGVGWSQGAWVLAKILMWTSSGPYTRGGGRAGLSIILEKNKIIHPSIRPFSRTPEKITLVPL